MADEYIEYMEYTNSLDSLDTMESKRWEKNFITFNNYIKENKPIPKNLIEWQTKQRYLYKRNEINQNRINLLETIPGWEWDIHNSNWMKRYNILVQFVKINGILPDHKNKELGRWIKSQRNFYSRKILSQFRIDKLEEIDIWEWSQRRYVWKCKCKQILKHNRIPNKKLKHWWKVQQFKYKHGLLSQDQIESLNKIPGWNHGFIESSRWIKKYNKLIQFVKNNRRLPDCKNKKLRYWVRYQRVLYHNNKLSQQRKNKLEEINIWKWT